MTQTPPRSTHPPNTSIAPRPSRHCTVNAFSWGPFPHRFTPSLGPIVSFIFRTRPTSPFLLPYAHPGVPTHPPAELLDPGQSIPNATVKTGFPIRTTPA